MADKAALSQAAIKAFRTVILASVKDSQIARWDILYEMVAIKFTKPDDDFGRARAYCPRKGILNISYIFVPWVDIRMGET